MADNEGKTRGSLLASIQSAQMAVGSAITGGAGAVVGGGDGGGSISLLEDIRKINKKSSKDTATLLQTMKDMFSFDKEKFNRLRDQATEKEKEKGFIGPMPAKAGGLDGGDGKSMPSLGKIAGLTALAAFMTAINADEILRLPQQLKSIRAMATFVKGVGTIGTLGFAPQILKNVKAAIAATSIKFPKLFKMPSTFDDTLKAVKAAVRGPLIGAQMQMTLLGISIKEKFTAFKLAITENKALKAIGGSIRSAMTNIKTTFEPVMNSIKSLFGGAGGKEGGALSKIMGPLKSIGKVIGKLFLPITLIMGVFDGVTGFMKEYEETGSIVDGIRGAVVGIVDGFIGNFVRLITDMIGMALSYLGLENLGAAVVAFGENITASFNKVIGGIVDVVTGLFTLDWERIKSGFGALFSGAGSFFLTTLSLPIDLAVNFIKDIFGFGDPDKPFSLKDFFFGEEGLITKVKDWFFGLFEFDFEGLGAKLFDMGRIFRALAAGGVAAVKAILPGGLSPGEAFRESYAASMKASEPVIVEDPIDLKGSSTTILDDRTIITEKTKILNQSGDTSSSGPIVVSMPTNAVSTSTLNNNASLMSPLDTGGKLKRRQHLAFSS